MDMMCISVVVELCQPTISTGIQLANYVKSQHKLDENLKSALSEMFCRLCEACDLHPSNIMDVVEL